MNPFRLGGSSYFVQESPQVCKACGDRHLYKQNDFNRSLGLGLIVVASLATIVLQYFSLNWWAVWSPMFLILIIDRLFSYLSPLVVICYRCGALHRGLAREKVELYDAFDLDLNDRLIYSERNDPNSPTS